MVYAGTIPLIMSAIYLRVCAVVNTMPKDKAAVRLKDAVT